MFKNSISGRNCATKGAANQVKKLTLALSITIAGLILVFTAQARDHEERNTFQLVPAADLIAACLPNATATVTVFAGDESRGVDTLDLRAEGLRPNTSFTVFLCELPNPPFGAAEYIGEFTTNSVGRASMRVETIINEAFASTMVGSDRVRKDLKHIVIWFADPADDDFCGGIANTLVTPFDGDGVAGITVLSSKNFLPGAPLPSSGPLPAATTQR